LDKNTMFSAVPPMFPSPPPPPAPWKPWWTCVQNSEED
jgi:hypothetical protein